MAKWEIIEDNKFKKQTGGKAATRTISDNRTASNSKPVVIQKPNITPYYIAEQDATYKNQPIIDKLKAQGIEISLKPKLLNNSVIASIPVSTNIDKPEYSSYADYTNKRYGTNSVKQLPNQQAMINFEDGNMTPQQQYNAQYDYNQYKNWYEQEKINDKVSQFLKANPIPKTNKEKANYIENLSPYDRQLIQSSSSSNEFLPAFRQYDNQIGEDAKKYTTADLLSDPTKFSEVTKAGLNRFRFFPNATNSIEDFVNPGLWFGQMEQGLGDIPKNIKEENYLAATMGIVNPLLMGRAAGSGSINPLGKSFWTNEVSNAQFINNLVNPLAGIVDANIVKGLGNKAVDKYIGSSFTPELGNVGVEAFGAVNPSTLKTNPFINTVEPQTSFFSRNPSVFTNRTIPQETIDLSRREVFRRIGERQPTTRRVYTLGNEKDLSRFNVDNNFIPPPPSEYQSAMNLAGVNFSEAELNAMNVRDIARGLQDNINTSSNLSRIDLDALIPYKDLTFNQLIIKNPSLAEKLKNAFKSVKLNIKNVADKATEKLIVANQKLGEIIEPKPIIDKNKFESDLQENLNKGVGIKKGDTQIQLIEKYPYSYQVHIKTPGETNFMHSGNLQFAPVQKQRSFTDILLNKNKYQGLQKPWDFPLEELKEKPNFNLDLPEYKGISAEIGEATKQALKNQNKKFDLLSSKSHTDKGGIRYLTEFLNGRKPAIDVSKNKEWLQKATELKNSLKGKPIRKEEVKKILAGDKYGADPNQEYSAIVGNPLFPNKVQFKYKEGGIIEDPMGQWAHPGSVTRIPSNQITMQGVNYPVLGISDRGHTQMMYPGEDYSFRGKSVTEYPMMQGGGQTLLRNQILNTRLPATNPLNFNRSFPTTSPLNLQVKGKTDYGVSLNNNNLSLSGGLSLENKKPNFRTGIGYKKGNWSGNANYSTNDNSFNTNANYSNNGFNVGAEYQRNNNNNFFNANVGYNGNLPVNFDANYTYDGDHSFDTNVGLNLGKFSGGLNYGYNQEGDRAHNFGANANLNLVKNLNLNADANFDSNKNYQVNAGLKYRFKDGGEVNFTYAGENHRVYEKESPTGNGKGIKGHIMVNHPTENKGKWDTIDLTAITNGKVKTIAQGVASTKKWHDENPDAYKNGGRISSWEIIEDVPQFQGGGKTNPPIYVNDPKDPRLQMYNDSLNYYNKSKNLIGNNAVDKHNTPVYIRKDVNLNILNNNAYDFFKGQPIDHSGKYDLNMNPNNNFPPPKIKQKILPIGGIGINKGNSMGGWYDIYAKPNQPYIVGNIPSPSNPPPAGGKGFFRSISGLPSTSTHSPGTVSYLTPSFKTISNPYLKKQEEIIPMNVMGLETLIPSQTMQKVPVPNPITSIPKDYYTIKTGSSYRNPETGAFEQQTFLIDKVTGKRITEPAFQNGGQTKSNWEILEDTNEDYEYKNGGKTPAWQRKEGKSPSGGLNAKGRASLKKEGHDIKPPQPEGGSRKKSFCARMTGLKKKLTGSKKANDPNSRVNLSLKKWKC